MTLQDNIVDRFLHRRRTTGESFSCDSIGNPNGYDDSVRNIIKKWRLALPDGQKREILVNDNDNSWTEFSTAGCAYLDYIGSDSGIYVHIREQDNGNIASHFRRERLSFDGVPPSIFGNQANFFYPDYRWHTGRQTNDVFPQDYLINSQSWNTSLVWPDSSQDFKMGLMIGRVDNADSLKAYRRYTQLRAGLDPLMFFLRSTAISASSGTKHHRFAVEMTPQGWGQAWYTRERQRRDTTWFPHYDARPTTPEEITAQVYGAVANGITTFGHPHLIDRVNHNEGEDNGNQLNSLAAPGAFHAMPRQRLNFISSGPDKNDTLYFGHYYNVGRHHHGGVWGHFGAPKNTKTSDSDRIGFDWYLGYSNTYRGFQRAFSRINRIYSEANGAHYPLKRMQWVGAYSSHRALNWSANQGWDQDSLTRLGAFLKVVSTQSVHRWNRSRNSSYIDQEFDDPHLAYAEVGLFHHNDSTSHVPKGYGALIVNTRLWPDRDSVDIAYYNEGMAPKDQRVPTLGDIDVRKVYMKIDHTKMHSSMQSSYYVVRDIWHPDTCWLVHKDSTFAVYVKPGDAKFLYIQKGTSIRVSPTASANTGDFEFNNGRRVAEIMNGTRSVVTYTREGQLYASYPAMGYTFEGYHEQSAADNIATGPEVMLDEGVTGKPSVMPAQNDTAVAIVYWYQTTAGSSQGKLKVAYRKHPDSTWKFATYDSLNFRSIPKDGRNVTPVLTPINDTSWIVVAQYGGVNDNGLGLTACRFHVDQAGQPTFFPDPKTYITEDGQSMRSRFPTIASRPLEDSLWPIRLGYERDGKIFRVMLKWRPGDTLTQSSHFEVSAGLPVNCNSKHPSIGMAGVKIVFNLPWPFPTFAVPLITEAITWEARIAGKLVNSADTLWPVLRTSIMPWQQVEPQWGAFTVFRADSSTLQTDHWPIVSIQPHEVVLGDDNSSSGSWKDHSRVMWQDVPRDGLEGRHWGAISGQDGDQWAKSFLHDGGRLPSIPQRTDSIQQWAKHSMVPKSISWITPGSSEMEVKITNGWMPQINRHYSFSTYYSFTVTAEDFECRRIVLDIAVKPPEIWPPTGTPRFPPLNPEPPFSGTPISHLWDPNPIRSFDVSSKVFTINADDSIAMYRSLDTIDITELRAGLNSGSDYVMLRADVLRAIDSSYLFTLDSIIVTPTAVRLPGSAPDLDPEYATLKIPSGAASDSVFIAIRMDRGEFNSLTRGVSQIVSDSETLVSEKRTTRQIRKPQRSGFLKLSVQPNPFMNATLVTVRTIEGMPTVIEMSDVSGRVVQRLFDGAADREEMHLVVEGDALASGTYFLRVMSGGEVETRKIQLVR